MCIYTSLDECVLKRRKMGTKRVSRRADYRD